MVTSARAALATPITSKPSIAASASGSSGGGGHRPSNNNGGSGGDNGCLEVISILVAVCAVVLFAVWLFG